LALTFIFTTLKIDQEIYSGHEKATIQIQVTKILKKAENIAKFQNLSLWTIFSDVLLERVVGFYFEKKLLV